MINLQIGNVNISYGDDGQVDSVQAHYTGRNEERTTYLNGYVPLSEEEYKGNEPIDKLEVLVRQSLINELQEGLEG